MSKRRRENKTQTSTTADSTLLWLPAELWPCILQHLLAKRDNNQSLANAEWILNWLATHRDAATMMGPHLAVWLRAVYGSNWKFLVRFAKRRTGKLKTRVPPLVNLSHLALRCGENELIQRELVYILMIAQREDELIYSCQTSYRTDGYCEQGLDISSDVHLCNTYFPYERRLHRLDTAHVRQMLPVKPATLEEALNELPPAVAYICRKGLRKNEVSRDEQRAIEWELQGEKARDTTTGPHTHLAYVLVQGTPLYSPHSSDMQKLRGLLYHHSAGNLSDEQRRAGLTLWMKRKERTTAVWKRVDRLFGNPIMTVDDITTVEEEEEEDDSTVIDDDESEEERRHRRPLRRAPRRIVNDESSYSSSQLEDSDYSVSDSSLHDLFIGGTDSDASLVSSLSGDSDSGDDERYDAVREHYDFWNGAPHSAVHDAESGE